MYENWAPIVYLNRPFEIKLHICMEVCHSGAIRRQLHKSLLSFTALLLNWGVNKFRNMERCVS